MKVCLHPCPDNQDVPVKRCHFLGLDVHCQFTELERSRQQNEHVMSMAEAPLKNPREKRGRPEEGVLTSCFLSVPRACHRSTRTMLGVARYGDRTVFTFGFLSG